MKVAGLDIGSTGCKLSLFGQDGGLVAETYREYGAGTTDEIDTDALWRHIQDMLAELAPHCADLGAIGVTSLGEAFVALDESDQALMPAPLYTDMRAMDQCEALIHRFGLERIARSTGLRAHAMFTLPKLQWLREKEPARFVRTRRILTMQDYALYRLTGAAVVDYATASRTLGFDVHQRRWDAELLAFAGIPQSLLSTPVPFGTSAGTIRPELAQALGLPASLRLLAAAHDQVAAAIGSGVLTAGHAVDGAGTVQCVTPVLAEAPPWQQMMDGGYAVVPFLSGQYVTYAFSFTGGALLKWFRHQFAQPGQDYAALDNLAPDGPTGLLVLPHFAGAATPYMDPSAKGAVVGLSIGTTAPELYKALMEGVAYEMRLNLERLRQANIKISRLFATGGGALSEPWLRIKADILDLPITTLGAEQAGTRGCAMLAATAQGLFPSLEAAAAAFVRPGKTYAPDPDRRAAYDTLYGRYKRLYPAIRTVTGNG